MLNDFFKEPLPAPLAGITNEPFRIILKQTGVKVTWSEMISAEGLMRNEKNTVNMVKIREEPPVTVLQLFGANPESLYFAAKKSFEEFGYNYIDINMGCPVKKVTKKGAGVALMEAPDKVARIVSLIKKIPINLFCKIRLGRYRENMTFFEILNIFYNEGVDGVIIHPRFGEDFFKGKAYWDYIKNAKEKYPDLFIIGNGDIFSVNDAGKMLKHTKCDSIMIGRQIAKDPFFIKKIVEYKKNKKIKETSLKEKLLLFKTLLYKLIEFYGETRALNLAKKYLILFTKGYPYSSDLRRKILKIKNCIEILNEIDYWNLQC